MNDAEDISQSLHRLDALLSSHMRSALKANRATLEEWWLLGLLSDGAGHTMSAVAAHTGMAAPSLTRLVDRLVAEALVYRRADDADRRRLLVYLTDRGRDRLARLRAEVANALVALREAGADLDALSAAINGALSAFEELGQGTDARQAGTGDSTTGAFFTSP